MSLRKKYIPYEHKSRAYKKRNFIYIKNKIREHAYFLGGLFTTNDMIVPQMGWVDIYFLSKKYKNTFYNVTIDSIDYAYKSLCDDKAWDMAERVLEESELGRQIAQEDIFCFTNESKEQKEKRLNREREIFSGLTWYEWHKKKSEELFETHQLKVYEQAKIDGSYRFGIGLHVILNVRYITRKVIVEFIEKFYQNEELPFVSAHPCTTQGLSWRPVTHVENENWKQHLMEELRCEREHQMLTALVYDNGNFSAQERAIEQRKEDNPLQVCSNDIKSSKIEPLRILRL